MQELWRKESPCENSENSSDGATPEPVLDSLMYELRDTLWCGGGGAEEGESGLLGCSDIRLRTA